MKKMMFLVALLALGFGCNSVEVSSKGGSGSMERVEKIYSQEYTLENSDITIAFEKDKVYGFAGVNRYFGSAVIDGDKISITNVATTMMMGDEKAMKEESEYLKNLSKMNNISIKDNQLILTDGSVTLVFNKN